MSLRHVEEKGAVQEVETGTEIVKEIEIDVDAEVHLIDPKEVVHGKGQEKCLRVKEGVTKSVRGVAKTGIVIVEINEINKDENGPPRRLKNVPRHLMNLQEKEHWYVIKNCIP